MAGGCAPLEALRHTFIGHGAQVYKFGADLWLLLCMFLPPSLSPGITPQGTTGVFSLLFRLNTFRDTCCALYPVFNTRLAYIGL